MCRLFNKIRPKKKVEEKDPMEKQSLKEGKDELKLEPTVAPQEVKKNQELMAKFEASLVIHHQTLFKQRYLEKHADLYNTVETGNGKVSINVKTYAYINHFGDSQAAYDDWMSLRLHGNKKLFDEYQIVRQKRRDYYAERVRDFDKKRVPKNYYAAHKMVTHSQQYIMPIKP